MAFDGFDFGLARDEAGPGAARSRRGALAYRAGLAAEQQVERAYAAAGMPVLARRWRGRHGEIDLVLRLGEGLVFVEVKSARNRDIAAQRVSPAQVQRIFAAGLEYADGCPRGSLTEMRFDLALVDGAGRVERIENAFA